MVKAAADEFSETEQFIVAAESVVGPYIWGKYDILCLPPSFPYGGMENPSLTFVTPSLLAGDKSLAGVVAHEIAHSWTGNLVGCRTWEHFWLNEGHTVFLERKIGAVMNGGGAATNWAEPGRLYFDFRAMGGWNALTESVRNFEEAGNLGFTCLSPDLSGGIDPDDAFSSVPYEKGFNTLYYLEKLVGGPAVFEPFLKSYMETFAHQSITTEDWKAYVIEYFSRTDAKVAIEGVDWAAIMGPGMPSWDPQFDTTLADAALNLAKEWLSGKVSGSASEVDGWNTQQYELFLDMLYNESTVLSVEVLNAMGEAYKFSSSRNSEVCFRWYKLNIQANNEGILDSAVRMVTSIGRMKFVRPLYRELFKMRPQLAIDTFKDHESFYNPICHKMTSQDLGLN